ncbi:phosphate/phosphite/phosphonate ABC transporter substrate-binding protein [Algoriphagus sp. AK58]|uniref:phosphate/phosphite/phosphonate ABC transporter substrate-binding protein n=1 Tax=Algoriphagus sp. AK58 TaxID=1406877 RepID=UPI00164F1F15|nr:PhnD/SsuA/transferrin family substrate-binding protein [Algoriphagus sp. AK58]MBC6368147.1 hypothetical protein [Algoriphagus sp. AK58]
MKSLTTLILVFLLAFAAKGQELILATYRYAENDRIKNITPLADEISRQTGMQVSVKSYPTVHEFVQAIQNDEVDIALINTLGYLLLESSNSAYSMYPSLVLQIRDNAKDNYKTAIVSSTASGIRTLADAKQQAEQTNLLLVSPGSTSGNLVPRLIFNSIGIQSPESVFKSTSYGKTHRATLEAVVDGKVELGALGSNEFFESQKNPELAKKIHLVWLSPEIPLGPVLLHKKIDTKTAKAIQNIFLNLHESNKAALEAVKSGWSEASQTDQYSAIGKDYYNSFLNQSGDNKGMEKILKQFSN